MVKYWLVRKKGTCSNTVIKQTGPNSYLIFGDAEFHSDMWIKEEYELLAELKVNESKEEMIHGKNHS